MPIWKTLQRQVSGGLISDSFTLALWRFTNLDSAGKGGVYDQAGPFVLRMLNSAHTMIPTSGPQSYAAVVSSEVFASIESDDVDSEWNVDTILQSEWTIEAWVWVDSSGSGGTIVSYDGGNVETEADNIQASLRVVSGNAQVTWEESTGTNIDATSSFSVPEDKWILLGAVKREMGSSGFYTISFYLDGVFQEEVQNLNNATGGTAADMRWYVGGLEGGSTDLFDGKIAEIRISSIARTAKEMAASYAVLENTRKNKLPYLVYDDDTLAQWYFNDPAQSPFVREVNGFYELNIVGSPVLGQAFLAEQSIEFNDNASNRLETADSIVSTTAAALKADFTVTFWVYRETDGTVVFWGNPDGTAGAENNTLFACAVTSTGAIKISRESGVRSLNESTTNDGLIPPRKWTFVAVRQFLRAGTNVDYQIFINGVARQVFDDVQGPEDGTGATKEWVVGATKISGTAADPLEGRLADLTVSTRIRTGTEIRTAYKRVTDIDLSFGHPLESATLALWRFEEAAGKIADDAKSYDLVPIGDPVARAGLFNTVCGYDYDGSTTYFSSAGDTTADTALLSSWTVEAWICPDDETAGTIIAYNNTGETEDDNALLRVALAAGGNITVFWENGAGTDVSNTTSGNFILQSEWQHIAVRKMINNGSCTVEVYHNGVLQETFLDVALPTGGTNSSWIIGASEPGSVTDFYDGRICEVRVSTVSVPSKEIHENYNRGRSDQKNEALLSNSTFTSDLLLQWLLQETSGTDVAEDLVGGFPGTVTGTPTIRSSAVSNRSRHFPTTSDRIESAGTQKAIDTLLGEWTIDCWVKLDSYGSGGFLFSYDNGVSEAQADNVLAAVGFDSSGNLRVHWEFSGGTDVVDIQGAGNAVALNTWTHVGWRKRDIGGGNFEVDYFVDGELQDTSGSLANADGGGNSLWKLGKLDLLSTTGFDGSVSLLRVCGAACADSHIRSAYRQGFNVFQRSLDSSNLIYKTESLKVLR